MFLVLCICFSFYSNFHPLHEMITANDDPLRLSPGRGRWWSLFRLLKPYEKFGYLLCISQTGCLCSERKASCPFFIFSRRFGWHIFILFHFVLPRRPSVVTARHCVLLAPNLRKPIDFCYVLYRLLPLIVGASRLGNCSVVTAPDRALCNHPIWGVGARKR